MKRDGYLWEEIHAALPGRSKGPIQVRYIRGNSKNQSEQSLYCHHVGYGGVVRVETNVHGGLIDKPVSWDEIRLAVSREE